jgi:hypothetical protein
MHVKCRFCQVSGWVCERHLERPWDGDGACGCRAPGAPCPACNAANYGDAPADAVWIYSPVRQEGLAPLALRNTLATSKILPRWRYSPFLFHKCFAVRFRTRNRPAPNACGAPIRNQNNPLISQCTVIICIDAILPCDCGQNNQRAICILAACPNILADPVARSVE